MILIAGAGIGGLTLALLLHEAGLRFRLFEAATAPPDYDLGFLLRPDAVATLRRLGFGAALARIGVPVRAEVRYGVDGRLVGRRDWPPDAGGLLSVHRGALHRLLAGAVKARAGPECLLYGLAVDDWTEGADGIALRLANRRDHSAAGDARGAVLVAADGIDSIARARIFPAEGAARWTGVAVWRGVAPGPRLDEVVILGDAACRMTLTPLPPDRQGMARINWIAERRMPPDSTWASLRRGGGAGGDAVAPSFGHLRGGGLDPAGLIRATARIYSHPMMDRPALPCWVAGRVALMGDAAHATVQRGTGGPGEAIADAVALAQSLSRNADPVVALAAYDGARRPPLTRAGGPATPQQVARVAEW